MNKTNKKHDNNLEMMRDKADLIFPVSIISSVIGRAASVSEKSICWFCEGFDLYFEDKTAFISYYYNIDSNPLFDEQLLIKLLGTLAINNVDYHLQDIVSDE
jgi:hypothetical protein